MERVVFLDRDGTLNEEVHYLHRTSDLKLLPGVPEALQMLKDKIQFGALKGDFDYVSTEHFYK